jgi:hypothetical protein
VRQGSFWDTAFMPFYRRQWFESRGDHHDDWGSATYYFWVHDGFIEQQVEVYESGVILAYDRHHTEDEFGGLSEVPLEPGEWTPFEIDLEAYQREVDGQPFNRA